MTYTKGIIQTLIGTGEPGYSGDEKPANNALLRDPFMCCFDNKGNIFIAEAKNHCVRRVDIYTNLITTIAGTGNSGYSGDGGLATVATMNEPYSLAIDPTNDDVYIVDRLNAAIRKIDGASSIITTVAGTGTPGYSGDGGPGHLAQLREPNDCYIDSTGGLLIADIQDQRIRRLDLSTGIISTFAGNGEKLRSGDGLQAQEASILGARAVCQDQLGNTYIAEREGNGIRKVDPSGIMSTLAGTGERGYSGDGAPAISATWGSPKAIRCDNAGNIIVVDTENHAIRKIDKNTNVVNTIAGGNLGSNGDGGEAIKAGLDRPHGCEVDTKGNIFIADSNNHRIRVLGAG